MRLSVPLQVVLGLLLLTVVTVLDATIWPQAMHTALAVWIAGQLVWSWCQGRRGDVKQVLLLMLFAAALFVGANAIDSSRLP